MDWTIPLLGLQVGLLVGVTGTGGASLMTPLLISVGGVRPVIAVGTDLVYGAITKAVGALLHDRRQTVDLTIAKHLGIGSIPMALIGVALISWVKGGAQDGAVDPFVSPARGFVLIIVALSLLLRLFHRQRPSAATLSRCSEKQKMLTVVLGAERPPSRVVKEEAGGWKSRRGTQQSSRQDRQS